ncbi:MAG: nitroreductase family protein [Bacteroidales bacterium]|nr:nitroreductase family protein [Bacteroidales bacterium]
MWAKNAPLLGISLARVNSQYNGKPNKYAFHDLGLAMGGLLAQATSMDIKVHQMAGFSVENAREGLLIPKEYEPVAMFAAGYYGKPDELPEDLQKRELTERKRKPLSEIVSVGSNFA